MNVAGSSGCTLTSLSSPPLAVASSSACVKALWAWALVGEIDRQDDPMKHDVLRLRPVWALSQRLRPGAPAPQDAGAFPVSGIRDPFC